MNEPRTLADRGEVAGTCVRTLRLTMTAVLDNMENSTDRAYSAWPDRLFLVGTDGNVAWKGAPGPQGFTVDGLRRALEEYLAGEGD